MVLATNVGGIRYREPLDAPSLDIATKNMANDLEPMVVPNYGSTTLRDAAYTALIAAGKKGMVCTVNNLGITFWNGIRWLVVGPSPKPYSIDHNFGTGIAVLPGSNWLDPTVLTIPDLINGQRIECEVQASIRVDGGTRQTIQLDTFIGGGSLRSTGLMAPTLVDPPTPAGSNDEFVLHYKRMSYYAATGDATLQTSVNCGVGAPRLVVQEVQLWATVYPPSV